MDELFFTQLRKYAGEARLGARKASLHVCIADISSRIEVLKREHLLLDDDHLVEHFRTHGYHHELTSFLLNNRAEDSIAENMFHQTSTLTCVAVLYQDWLRDVDEKLTPLVIAEHARDMTREQIVTQKDAHEYCRWYALALTRMYATIMIDDAKSVVH